MAIELVTFGGLHILDDEGELDWLAGQRSRAALLVYLAVERRVSREALTTVFWPESDAENARHALRQSLYHLRKAVNADWVESLSHDLAVTDDVRADVHEFTDTAARGDLESAIRLYRGPFLQSVHLVDLSSWESWVDSRRAQYARMFRKASRDLLESKRTTGNLAAAVEVAELWAARDPLDDEAQHRLIETLAEAGERAEAIRQYDTYSRMRESDGLEPATETRDLIDRIRSEFSVVRSVKPPAEVAGLSAPPAELGTREELKGWRPSKVAPVAIIASLVLLASLWGLKQKQTEQTPVSNTIAVLPFSVHGGQSVAYLREGMVNLLAAAFDGAELLRPVDTRATFAAAADLGDRTTDPAYGEHIAGRLNAAMYVVGDVVEAGKKLQISGAIYRRGASEPSAKGVVTGPGDSVFALADRLVAQLLAGLSDPAADRLVRTASTATSSLPAFKEYLQGDRLMRAGQFERAADSYLAAIAYDSTFAIAYYRLGLAREWAPLPGEDRAAAAAARFAARLSPRDRTLLEAFRAWRSGNALEAQRAYRAIIARYPDDLDAWFQLGEIQFHQGPLLGRSIGESEQSWRKVLSYEPRNLFAVTHLARIALISNRLSTVDSLLATISSAELRTDRRLAEIVLLRAVARADTTTSRELANEMRKWEDLSAWRVAVFLTAFNTRPAAMRAVVQSLTDQRGTSALHADIHWFASLLDLSSGRLDASRRSVTRAVAIERSVAGTHRRYGFDAVTEWSAATLPLPYADSTLIHARERAASWQTASSRTNTAFERETELGAPLQIEPLRHYTLGVLSLRLRDTAAAVTAAATLHRLATAERATILTRDLDRGLRARLAFQRGDRSEALQLLESLECRDLQGDIAATAFAARASERFLHAEVLSAAGRHREALEWLASLGHGSVSEVPLRAPSYLRQAEIYDRLGSREQAAAYYARFVELWSDADPEFEPVVRTARLRLSALAALR